MEETSFSTKSLIAAATPGKVALSSCETKDLSDVQRRPTMLLLIVSYITCLTVRVLKPCYQSLATLSYGRFYCGFMQ